MSATQLARTTNEELANAIVFVASDEASFINAHVLNVDGGKTAG